MLDPRVEALMKIPQPEQRSLEWYKARKNKITASSAACLLIKDDRTCDDYIKEYNLENSFEKNGKCANPYSKREDYIMEKASGVSNFTGNVATYWGQKYEPVATQIYEKRAKQKVYEFGLLPHKTIPFISASPDGIREDGVMLEIKCPYRRKITGIPPFYYWIQVMLQLEVCDLDSCDFLEIEFVEYNTLFEFMEDSIDGGVVEEKGLIIQITDIPEEFDKMEYVYPPMEATESIETLLEWKEQKIKELQQIHKAKTIDVIYWKAICVSIVNIKRNNKWFESILPDLAAGLEEIKEKRELLKNKKNKKTLFQPDFI
jgi:putative phage-type endonuclease